MQIPPDLSVIILNWNVANLLEACLRSLPAALAHWAERAEIIVVDNASSDSSIEMVRREFPGVKVIELSTNLGFSAGNNAGIRASQGKYVFLLNPDTVAEPGAIALLADYTDRQEDVAIVGPRLLNPDGTLQPSRRRFPTIATAIIESTPLQAWMPGVQALRRYYMLDVQDDCTQDVDWVSGAALMCRKAALEQAGMLDPGYFMFSEEMDLCRRVSRAGWRVIYLPGAVITHYGGQSTGQDVPSRHIRFNTSKARYFRIHAGKLAGSAVRLYLLGIYVMQVASEALKWLLGHKRALRRRRLSIYSQVLRSGLREHPSHLRQERNVLLITGEYPPAQGGVGDYTCKLNMALQRHSFKAGVLTRASSNTHISHPSKPPATGTGSIPCAVPKITLSAVLRAARGMRAGVVHIQYQTGAYDMRPIINLLPLLLGRKWRGATVVTFHDLLVPYLFPKAGPLREQANRLLARSASACIVTNPQDAARLRSWGVKQVRLIPIGSNIPCNPPAAYDRAEWRMANGITEDTVLLAYFGFLNSSKGLIDLLAALARLKESGNYRLLMVGGGLGSSDPTNRATAERVQRKAQESGVDQYLIWTGYLDPRGVSAALLSADIAVLPFADGASFRRGSLLAVLEHGLPVITTCPHKVDAQEWNGRGAESEVPSGGVPELVQGENTLLVTPGDVSALVESVELLAGDPSLRARLAAGAREIARSFGWDNIARLHAAL